MRNLARSMNPGVGSARTDNCGPTNPKKGGERRFELTLHGRLSALPLPTVERSAVIGDFELQSTGHRGHPRMDRCRRGTGQPCNGV